MANWFQLTIKTNYHRSEKARAFSLIKNVLDRAVWQNYFYTQAYEDEKLVIRLRILEGDGDNMGNRERIGVYLVGLRGSAVESHIITEYERNHIIEALIRSSRLAIGMDFLPSQEDAAYLVHCILENLFLDSEEEIAVYKELTARIEEKVKRGMSKPT